MPPKKHNLRPDAQLALAPTDPVDLLTLRWALGMASDLRFCAILKRSWSNASDGFLPLIGLSPVEVDKLAAEQIAARCNLRWRELGDVALDAGDPVLLNTRRLGEILGLRPVEVEVLTFYVFATQREELTEALSLVERYPYRVAGRLVARALGRDPVEVAEALSRRAALRTVGLLANESPVDSSLAVPPALAQALVEPHATVDELTASLVEPASAAKRQISDFAHLGDTLKLLVRVLSRALSGAQRGIGLLIHGASGTGKSELVRVLAANAGARLFSVQVADRDGDPMHPMQRLASLRLTQRLVARGTRNVVLFDEIEDLFPDTIHPFGRVQRRGEHKGFLGRVIEELAVPTFWVSNEIAQIDPALVRRFDLVVEMRPPPVEARRRIVDVALEGLAIGKSVRERVARVEGLTPAEVQRAARLVRLLGPDSEADAETLLGQVLAAHVQRIRIEPARKEIEYGVELLGASVDLDAVARGLGKHGDGTVLLHGPPGTGKSAFARHVAERIGRSVIARNASDLLSMWVGGTEKNLAAAFASAEDAGAVLVLDEIDSLLQARDRARASWEVSQVNELLVQIERFGGILFGTTNGLDRLDTASLRRFSMKIAFEPPGMVARAELFRRLAAAVELDLGDGEATERMTNASGVVPGDFATVLAATRLSADDIDGAWLERRLREEVALRRGNRRTVGFTPAGGPS